MQRDRFGVVPSKSWRWLLLGVFIGPSVFSMVQGAEIAPVRNAAGNAPEIVIAVKDVCAWPNLTQLRDGTIVATIHNQPSHLKMPADVDCWASMDNGQTWTKRGTPAPRDNATVARGNVAAGVGRNGDLIVIASGWSDPAGTKGRGTALPPLVSRSSDGGVNWDISRDGFPGGWSAMGQRRASPEGYLIPFGDILPGQDGTLRVCMYGGELGSTCVYRSEDDGRTWKDSVRIDPETAVLEPAFVHLEEGNWLLASRENGLTLYTSNDDGRTWSKGERLSDPNAHPGHFLLLKDRRIVLTYGNRNAPHGVDARISSDHGKTWSEPRRVSKFMGDGGYPTSVELPDGRVLTAYYAKQVDGYNGYHMGVVHWAPKQTWE